MEVPKQVKIDLWKAKYTRLLIGQTHCTLEHAIDSAHAKYTDIDGDIGNNSPQSCVSDEVLKLEK
jgi:hypothetical protein